MAFNEIELQKIETVMTAYVEKHRPPEHIRPQLDIGFRVEKYDVVISEIRPNRLNPEKKMESPIAKATFVRTQNLWRVFWQRADLKWHEYATPEVPRLEDFLALVEQDAHGCFWG